MEERNKMRLAQERAEAKIGFYVHAGIFVAVNLLLVAINLATDPGTIWFIWPLIGWGVGLIGHGYLVYSPRKSGDFKQKLIEKELKNLEKQQKAERV